MPVCITGMHRSGTSMVSRMINLCGLYLGPENELMSPAPHNPEGYWENLHFVELNDRLLAHLGGGWDFAPAMDQGWELGPEIAGLSKEAAELIDRFNVHDLWGWKDPRNSLTLPFWQRLIPDLKVVVCIRNPVEVARSLFLRGDAISPSQFQLWLTYYQNLLSATRPEHRLVTHYQSYFHDAHAELRRVVDWLDTKVCDETIAHACSQVSNALRHHNVMAGEFIEADVPDEVLGLYSTLCSEAGPVYRQARMRQTAGELDQATARATEVATLVKELQQLRSTHNEILRSKSFRLASWFWRLRHRR